MNAVLPIVFFFLFFLCCLCIPGYGGGASYYRRYYTYRQGRNLVTEDSLGNIVMVEREGQAAAPVTTATGYPATGYPTPNVPAAQTSKGFDGGKAGTADYSAV